MDLKRSILRFSIFALLFFILFLVFACSLPSWFPIKTGPPHKAKYKEMSDKEVVIIDREEYVKVLNPAASAGENQPKYLYIPITEYLSKKEAYVAAGMKREEQAKRLPDSAKTLGPEVEMKESSPSPSALLTPHLRKKVVVTHFDDQTAPADEKYGDLIAQKLIKELDRRTQQIVCVDYQMLKEFLEARGTALTDLEKPETLRFVNEVFGVHALVFGQLSGPYVFVTKGGQSKKEAASAIIRIEMRLVETLSGKTLKTLSANNPVVATQATGSFPEEKATAKAIDLTIADLGRSLAQEIDGLDWFGRVAKVDGESIYLNAGRLTGLRTGDVLEVRDSGGSTGEVKSKIRISTCFGIDASMGRLIQGKKPEMNDILKLARREDG